MTGTLAFLLQADAQTKWRWSVQQQQQQPPSNSNYGIKKQILLSIVISREWLLQPLLHSHKGIPMFHNVCSLVISPTNQKVHWWLWLMKATALWIIVKCLTQHYLFNANQLCVKAALVMKLRGLSRPYQKHLLLKANVITCCIALWQHDGKTTSTFTLKSFSFYSRPWITVEAKQHCVSTQLMMRMA